MRAVWQVEDYLAEALDRTFGDVVVDVGHVFVEFGADFFNSFIRGDFGEDFELDEFYICRFIILQEKVLKTRQEILLTPFSNDKIDMRNHIITNFITIRGLRTGHQRNQGCRQPIIHLLLQKLVLFRNIQKHFHSPQKHTRTRMF